MTVTKREGDEPSLFLCAKLYLPIRNVSYTETKPDANIH
jgi:hypothetical protein